MESLQPKVFRPKEPYDDHEAWADNRLPSTDALAGREIALVRDDGRTVTYAFDTETVSWQEPGERSVIETSYDAVELRKDVFSADFLQTEAPGENTSTRVGTSLALNTATGSAILVRQTITLGESQDFRQDIYPCTIAGSSGTLPEMTAELVGRRAYAEYSDGTAAEHVYLNPRRIGWQGLGHFEYSGSECDEATTWKLGDKLYVLTFVRDTEPTGVVLLLDYVGLRNAGVIMGRDDRGFFHFPVGARLAVLGDMPYPPGYEPAGLAVPPQTG
ncbi:MAG TPA: MoaF N-terminal domain-containing protein [Acidimicrobiales bacterium]|nr:MoaF N-terminal domain-containing protein [Acidimicrobiales bacterium]